MSRPLALDAYSCAGLFAEGMRAAGWEVVCLDVDRNALRHAAKAGFATVEGDALRLLADHGFMRQFLWGHAAPPCQGSSATRELARAQARAAGRPLGQGRAVQLIEPTRELLQASGVPWTIENVTRSVVRHWPGSVRLCGSSFGLPIERHRWIGSSDDLELVGSACRHAAAFDVDERTGKPRPWGVYGSLRDEIPSGGRTVRSIEQGHDVMGVTSRRLPWRLLAEGCPPAYGQHIGEQVLAALGLAAAA